MSRARRLGRSAGRGSCTKSLAHLRNLLVDKSSINCQHGSSKLETVRGDMTDVDLAYFMRKAREEREMALNSPDAAVAASHLTVAEQYERVLAAYQPIVDGSIRGFN